MRHLQCPKVKEAEDVVVALLAPDAVGVDDREAVDDAVPEGLPVGVAVGASVPVLEELDVGVLEPELLGVPDEVGVLVGDADAVEVRPPLLEPVRVAAEDADAEGEADVVPVGNDVTVREDDLVDVPDAALLLEGLPEDVSEGVDEAELEVDIIELEVYDSEGEELAVPADDTLVELLAVDGEPTR